MTEPPRDRTPWWFRVFYAMWFGALAWLIGWEIAARDWPAVTYLSIILALLVITEIRTTSAYRAGYRLGWITGRTSMLVTMTEAARRGMSGDEWILGEAERDGMDTARIRAAMDEHRDDG